MKKNNYFPQSEQPQEQRDGSMEQTRSGNSVGRNGSSAEQANAEFVEFPQLMSLALDGLLDARETQQFEEDLARYPKLAEDWTLWQRIHTQFTDAPAVAPPCDFMQTFQARLAQQIRRRNLRFGIILGVLTVVMWLSVVAGGVAVGAYLLDQQSVWLGQFVHNATYLLNMATLWGTTLVDTVSTVLYTPQAWAVALGYLSFVALVLAFWTRFLRRSTYVFTEA